jgi:hypothetical protein
MHEEDVSLRKEKKIQNVDGSISNCPRPPA